MQGIEDTACVWLPQASRLHCQRRAKWFCWPAEPLFLLRWCRCRLKGANAAWVWNRDPRRDARASSTYSRLLSNGFLQPVLILDQKLFMLLPAVQELLSHRIEMQAADASWESAILRIRQVDFHRFHLWVNLPIRHNAGEPIYNYALYRRAALIHSLLSDILTCFRVAVTQCFQEALNGKQNSELIKIIN